MITTDTSITDCIVRSTIPRNRSLYVLQVINIYNENTVTSFPRPSRTASRNHAQHHLRTNLPRTIPTKTPLSLVNSARVFCYTRSINPQRNRNVPAVRKLGPRSQTNLTTTAHSTSLDVDVVAVLEQNRIVTRVGHINCTNLRAARRRHAEDAATASTRLDTVDVDVGAVTAVELSGFVGETQSCVSGARAAVVAVYGADLGVGNLLEEEAAFSDVLADYGADIELVDVPDDSGSVYVSCFSSNNSIPCLHAVRRAAVAGDGAHFDVCVCRSVAVESNAHPVFEVEVDGAQGQIRGTGEAHAEVRRACHGEVGDLDAGLIRHFDVSSSALGSNRYGTAAFESFSASNGEGARADGSGGYDGDPLATADAIDGALNS
jgi:hypothetical protein